MRALLAVAVAIAVAVLVTPAAAQQPRFDDWLDALLAEARSRGYSDELLQQTLAGLTPLERVLAADRTQAESVLTFEEYVRRRITPDIVRRGRELAYEHAELLQRVHEAYGVPPPVILSIWANESRFGRWSGDVPVFQSLATLAWNPRRARFFRGELFDALAMVKAGHIDAASMLGSWAGAMGQPQFMPSSYLAYAVDFDGDGRRDIWASHADTFASIANYLKRHGWRGGERWGREVELTADADTRATRSVKPRRDGCRAMRDMRGPATLATWQKLGVRLPGGDDLPNAPARDEAALIRAGRRRFLVHDNYDAILRYNCAQHYALTVAILADRIGADP
ncbi:MAG: lytic murein transglycosylase [Candidatus Rokubacteria bacterium]|nr:lytic murein transglycosylase [Candidatus Rokubacteria bacterium]